MIQPSGLSSMSPPLPRLFAGVMARISYCYSCVPHSKTRRETIYRHRLVRICWGLIYDDGHRGSVKLKLEGPVRPQLLSSKPAVQQAVPGRSRMQGTAGTHGTVSTTLKSSNKGEIAGAALRALEPWKVRRSARAQGHISVPLESDPETLKGPRAHRSHPIVTPPLPTTELRAQSGIVCD